MDGKPLAGKRALVTGAAVRLGRAIALELARAGADIVVHHHTSAAAARQTAAEIAALGVRAVVVQADQVQPAQVGAMFEQADRELGGLDVLVNSAGILERVPVEELSVAQWRRMLDVNLTGPFLCCREAIPRLQASGGGAIVNVIDVAAERPWRAHAHYCASKAGLAMLTRALALELAPRGIRVNGVSPGAVLLPEATDEASRARVLARVPQGRAGNPADVARTVLFLVAGPSYITGQILAVDGGRSLA